MRRKRNSDATRTAILKAALRLFGEHGYHQTSITMVANEANVYRSSIAFYFGTKEDLLRGVFEFFIEEWLGHLAQRAVGEIHHEDKVEVLQNLLDTWILDFDRNPEQKKATFRLAIEASQSNHNPLHETSRQMFENFRNILTGLVIAGQQADTISKSVPAKALGNTMMLAALGYQYAWYTFPDMFEPGQCCEDLRFVLGGLKLLR